MNGVHLTNKIHFYLYTDVLLCVGCGFLTIKNQFLFKYKIFQNYKSDSLNKKPLLLGAVSLIIYVQL